MRVILTVISCSVALLLVQLCAQPLPVYLCIYIFKEWTWDIKPQASFKKSNLWNQSWIVFSQVFSTNVVHTWMIIYPFEKLRCSAMIIAAL